MTQTSCVYNMIQYKALKYSVWETLRHRLRPQGAVKSQPSTQGRLADNNGGLHYSTLEERGPLSIQLCPSWGVECLVLLLRDHAEESQRDASHRAPSATFRVSDHALLTTKAHLTVNDTKNKLAWENIPRGSPTKWISWVPWGQDAVIHLLRVTPGVLQAWSQYPRPDINWLYLISMLS